MSGRYRAAFDHAASVDWGCLGRILHRTAMRTTTLPTPAASPATHPPTCSPMSAAPMPTLRMIPNTASRSSASQRSAPVVTVAASWSSKLRLGGCLGSAMRPRIGGDHDSALLQTRARRARSPDVGRCLLLHPLSQARPRHADERAYSPRWVWLSLVRPRGQGECCSGAAGLLRSGSRVRQELPYLLRTAAGDGDLRSPLQRLLV
jgi:hypothetical protein